MRRKVCKNKAQHHAKVMNKLDVMRSNGDHCDFTIKVGNMKFQAHRNMLSAGSEYFEAMLKHDNQETRTGEVEMKNMDSECLKCCIDFIYTGEFNFPDGKISELLHASQMLQLNEVKDTVVEELEKTLTTENFFSIRHTASLFSLRSLILKCKQFEAKNFMAISLQPEFLNEDKAHIIDIVSSTDFEMSEKEKLELTVNWVGERDEKKKDLLELLKLIDLKEVPADFLENLIDHHSLISNDITLYKTLNKVHKAKLKKSQLPASSATSDNINCKSLILFNKDANCLQKFDPVTSELTTFFKVKFGHMVHSTAISLNDDVYVLCKNKSVHRLNTKVNDLAWEKLEDMIDEHGRYPPVVPALGSLFVIGRGNDLVTSNTVEVFLPATGHWSRLKDKPEQIRNPALVPLDDLIYCIGGYTEGRTSTAFSKFNAKSQEWVDLQPMRSAKEACAAVLVEQKIFVFGGYRDDQELNEVECYDFTTAQWFSLSPMIQHHWFLVAHHISGYIFMAYREGKSNTLMKYDVKNDKWHEIVIKNRSLFTIYDIVKI